MDEPLILYSTQTWLAYAVAERFYGGVHHAWCSPVYDGTTAARHVNIPPSSSPAEIYRVMAADARRGERHSALFTKKLDGIRTGAKLRAAAGEITAAQEEEIDAMLKTAHPRELRPVLYVIPFDTVKHIVHEVPLTLRAHPFSVEFQIPELPRNLFDMIETGG